MTETRSILAILAYHSGGPPSFADFAAMMKGERYSLDRYWRDNAGGVIDITRFDTVGPYAIALPAISVDAQGNSVRPNRRTTADLARAAAEAAGVDLSPYDATLVALFPAQETVNGVVLNHDVGASGDICVLPAFATNTFNQHESGHVLGFQHSQGVLTTAGDFTNDGVDQFFSDYGDPYDIMSAESFGFASPTMSVPGTPTASWPRSAIAGPMLSRAELFLFKPDHMDAAGTVLHRAETGNTSVTVFPAGTGAPGRPELLVYATSGGGQVFVEYRRPGTLNQGSWWDSGLQDDVQRGGVGSGGNVPAALVVHFRAPNDQGKDAVWYAGRIAFPDADLDTTFSTPDGTFTVRVGDAQHPAGDSVTFTISRGTPAQKSLMLHEDSVDTVRVLSSELRRHPAYPGEGPFTWNVGEHVRHTTYTPRVLGVGTSWPQEITAHSNVVMRWSAAGSPFAEGTTGRQGTLDYTLALGTGVLEVWNRPEDGTISVELDAEARDHSVGGFDAVAAADSVRYEVNGRWEGWGADFFAFLARRLKERVNRRILVDIDTPVPRPGPVERELQLDRDLMELLQAQVLLGERELQRPR